MGNHVSNENSQGRLSRHQIHLLHHSDPARSQVDNDDECPVVVRREDNIIIRKETNNGTSTCTSTSSKNSLNHRIPLLTESFEVESRSSTTTTASSESSSSDSSSSSTSSSNRSQDIDKGEKDHGTSAQLQTPSLSESLHVQVCMSALGDDNINHLSNNRPAFSKDQCKLEGEGKTETASVPSVIYPDCGSSSCCCNVGNNEPPSSSSSRRLQYHFRLGVAYWKQAMYDASIIELHLALAVCNNILKDPSQSWSRSSVACTGADIYWMLGKVYYSLGRYVQSKKVLKKAVVCITKEQQKHQGRFSSSSNQNDKQNDTQNDKKDRDQQLVLAKVLLATGRAHEALHEFDKALGYYQDAIWIQLQVMGESEEQNHNHRNHNHHHLFSDIACSFVAFGSFLEKYGQLDMAIDCFREAHDIYQEQQNACFREATVDQAVTLAHIGWILFLQGNNLDALSTYERALALQVNCLGTNHRNVASTLTQMGMVEVKLNRPDQALIHFRNAIEIQQATFGDKHEDLALSLFLLGSVYEGLGLLPDAISCVWHSTNVRARVHGRQHLLVGATLFQLGELYLQDGKVDDANHCYILCLDIYQHNNLKANGKRMRQVVSRLEQSRNSHNHCEQHVASSNTSSSSSSSPPSSS